MLVSDLLYKQYKTFPIKHKSALLESYKTRFNYRSNRRFKEILRGIVHPTLDEYNFLTDKINEYSAFYKAKSDATTKTVPLQILQ